MSRYSQTQQSTQDDSGESDSSHPYYSSYNDPQGSNSFAYGEQHQQQYQPQQQPSPYRSGGYRYSDYEDSNDFNSYPQFNRQQSSSSVPWWFQKLLEWMEYITRPKVAVVVALVVIAVFHFQDSVTAWLDFYFPPHVSFYESCVALFWQGADWIRGNLQRGMELARNLQPGALHARNRIPGLAPNLDLSNNNRFHILQNAQMPELESFDDATTTGHPSSGMTSPEPNHRFDKEPLPPAFLNETDYPQGWMVYHPVLGVAFKTDADAFDEQAKQKLEQDQQQASNQSNVNHEKIDKSPSVPQQDKENIRNKQQQKSFSSHDNESSNTEHPAAATATNTRSSTPAGVHKSNSPTATAAIQPQQQQLTPTPSVVAANG